MGKAKNILEPLPQRGLSRCFDVYCQDPLRCHCGPGWKAAKKRVWDEFVSLCVVNKITAIDQISLKQIYLFRDALLKRALRPKTCNEYVNFVIQILVSAGVPREKFAGIRRLPFSSEPMQFFTQEQLRAVFQAIDGKMDLSIPDREEMKVLFRLLAWSGLRLKDACLLKWGRVDLQMNVIFVRPFKTTLSSGEFVALPIHPGLRDSLDRAASWRDSSNFVLPCVAKRYLRCFSTVPQLIARTIDWTLWKDKVPGRRPPKAGKYGAHSFRHTFATFLMNNGVDPEIIAKMLGQKSLAITRIYMHLVPQTVQKIMAALPKLD